MGCFMTKFYPIEWTNGNYLINKHGDVFSVRSGLTMKPFMMGRYLGVNLSGKKRYIHRLVAEQFIGDVDGMTVNHKDLNKKNNRVENLEIVTQAENNAHARANLPKFKVRPELIKKGEDVKTAKLSEGDVVDIAQRIRNGESITALAEEYGVCFQNISMIKRGKTWAHLTGGEIVVDGRKCIQGKGNPSSITEEKAMEVMIMLRSGMRNKDVIAKSGVSGSTVVAIKMGRHWINKATC